MDYTAIHTDTPPYREFIVWTQENSEIGVDGNGDERSYIPPDKLRQYADHDRVGEFLGADDRDAEIHMIQDYYLLVFFILVYITDPEHLWTRHFLYFYERGYNDCGLPLPKPPDEGTASSNNSHVPFPNTPDGLNAWRAFYEHQWRFLPVCILDSGKHSVDRNHGRTQLRIRHIIPVTVDPRFNTQGGSSARLLKVTPHKSSGLPQTPIIMKEYTRQDLELFNQERRAYTAINNIPKIQDAVGKYILRYYGSFIQADRCVIFLEYADRGTLLDLYKDDYFLPRDEQGARMLWDGLGMLFHGLEIIHNRGQNNRTIHQDIKPANIFVFSDPEDSGRLVFKLGDLGLSSTSRPNAMGDAIGQVNHGSRMYSDPGITQWSPDFQDLESPITWIADIWSFGCLLFETAVWMATSDQGRKEFRQARVKQGGGFGRLADAGYRGAFHDGFEVLPALREKMNEISEFKTPVARLSLNVMGFVLEEMLVPQNKTPLTALRLRERFCRILETPQPEASEPQGSSQTASVLIHGQPLLQIVSPIDSERRDVQIESQAMIPLRQNSQEYGDIRGNTDTSDEKDRNRPRFKNRPPLKIPDVIKWMRRGEPYKKEFDEVRAELHTLKGRDQVFVVDNSASMCRYWEDVKLTANGLSYLVKDLGPRGFEVRMTNSPMKTRRRNCRSLFDDNGLFDRHRARTSNGKCQMEVVLSDILLSVVKKAATCRPRWAFWKPRKAKGVDVYVLTDGVWEANSKIRRRSEACGVENAIAAVVKYLQQQSETRTFLSIQFIRFGQDKEGIKRLRWLDDKIKPKMGGWDIVDTTPHDGSVRKMLLGPKNVEVDNVED